MHTIAIALQKGGVGKTSIAGNIAAELASRGYFTACVDVDPQGNLSSWLCDSEAKWELSEVLEGDCTVTEALRKVQSNLWMVPTFAIGGGLKEYSETKLFAEPFVFEDMREAIAAKGFDYLVMDLSPGMGQLERCALLAANEVITPMAPEYFSVDGLEIFTDFLGSIRRGFRKAPQHQHIVLNMINRSFRRHRTYTEAVAKLEGYTIHEIPQDSHVAEAQAVRRPLRVYDPHSRAQAAVCALCASLQGVA